MAEPADCYDRRGTDGGVRRALQGEMRLATLLLPVGMRSVAVNRVALTSRRTHAATAESSDQVYAFFESALRKK